MPIDKYLYIRKAAEIEEIVGRIQFISDINAAFSGNKDKMTDLQKLYTQAMGFDALNWQADPNWEEELKKFQR